MTVVYHWSINRLYSGEQFQYFQGYYFNHEDIYVGLLYILVL